MSVPADIPFPDRSTDPCPHCGRHELALVQPPHVPVMGAQPYTEIYRLGDLPMPVGVRCRACGTGWATIEALRAGEPGTAGEIDPVEGLDVPDAPEAPDEPAHGDSAAAAGHARGRERPGGGVAVSVVLVVVLLAVGLIGGPLLLSVVVIVMAAAIVARSLRRARR